MTRTLIDHGLQKRKRRTKQEITDIENAIRDELEKDHPQTVRGIFYRLIVSGTIPKADREYKNTVVRLLSRMRRRGQIPYSWIVDYTRIQRKPRSHANLEEALEDTRDHYRRALWNDQEVYVEIWCEKRALGGILYQETSKWDVPLMIGGGFSSLTFLQSAGEDIEAIGKPTFIYHLGDHDPSGRCIARVVEREIRKYAPSVEITFVDLAVTPEQIHKWNLPSRPTKKTDTRAKTFKGRSTELDAIPAHKLRELVRDSIEQHIDQGILNRTLRIEAAERKTLDGILAKLNGRQA